MILVDSHCHLDMLAEKNDLNEIIKHAESEGVKYLQTICTKFEDLPSIVKIAEKFENVFASVGVHPNDIDMEVNYQQLLEFCKHPKIVSFGETGLDYYYQNCSKEKQINAFKQHIIAAQKAHLPLVIHTRSAEEDTFDILKEEMKNASFSGLIHCFTAAKEFARQMLDLGMYISIAGVVTFKNADLLKEAVRFIPLDRLLIETDSPYLAPIPMRGKQNEPAFVKYVAEYIANLKGLSIEEIANKTTDNFFTLFSKCPK